MTRSTEQLGTAAPRQPDAAGAPGVPEGGQPAPITSWWQRGRRWLPDVLALGALLGTGAAVNDIRGWISAPYWFDEVWVALSTRVPARDVPDVTSVTPVGWSYLLRLAPGPDQLRVVPMAFAALAVVAGYLLGRGLGWRTRTEAIVAGLAVGGAVTLLPAEQLRHDLKPYTADAAVTLALLAGLVWLERAWSRRRLAVLALGAPLALLVSQIALLAAITVFGALGLVFLIRRDWRRLAETAVAALAAGVPLVAIYLVWIAPHRNPSLTGYWQGFFPKPHQLPEYLHTRTQQLAPTLGLPHIWQIGALGLAGVATLLALRRPATVLALALLGLLMVVLGVARLYPLLDARTSYFLLVVVAAVCGVAVAGSAVGIARWALRRRAVLWRQLTAGAVVLTALAGFAAVNRDWYRPESRRDVLRVYSLIELEDVRTQVRWTDAHRTPADVVLISNLAVYGYAFYHEEASPVPWQRSPIVMGWIPVLPAGQNVVVTNGYTLAAIQAAVTRAVRLARHNGPRSRIFLIRSHWAGQRAGWASVLAPYRVSYPYQSREPVAVVAHP